MNTQHRPRSRTRGALTAGAILSVTLITLTACSPPQEIKPSASSKPAAYLNYERQADETPAGFDLDQLVAAAQQEGPLTVYDMSGKIVTVAENFSAKYGIPTTGVKIDERPAMIEKVVRESEANSVVGDVVIVDDLAAVANELLVPGHLTNWVPGDLSVSIPQESQVPLVLYHGPVAWAYNTQSYATCPVTNIWQLTDDEWRGKVALVDPLNMPWYFYWFNQMENNLDAEFTEAYANEYGEKLVTTEKSAVAEWVKRLAANDPVLNPSDEETSAAIGTPDQANPMVGNLHVAKFRNNTEKGYALGVCDGLEPFALADRPASISIAAKSKSPNAAKLFVHFMMTEEGFAPQIVDGKVPSNTEISMVDDAAHVRDFTDQMMPVDLGQLEQDWLSLETWQDYWRVAKR